MDGGYRDYVLVPFQGLALVPDEMSPIEAGPLMCAGITTFNSLRNSGARWGDRVAILGIGGLGHLGVQFASKMGFRTIAIARGTDKERLARQLGAQHYINSEAGAISEALLKLGGVNAAQRPALPACSGRCKTVSGMPGAIAPSNVLANAMRIARTSLLFSARSCARLNLFNRLGGESEPIYTQAAQLLGIPGGTEPSAPERLPQGGPCSTWCTRLATL